jgi:hypothetical protein
MTSERYEPITPARHEQAEVTDSDVNEALERGDLDEADLAGKKVRQDEDQVSEDSDDD